MKAPSFNHVNRFHYDSTTIFAQGGWLSQTLSVFFFFECFSTLHYHRHIYQKAMIIWNKFASLLPLLMLSLSSAYTRKLWL